MSAILRNSWGGRILVAGALLLAAGVFGEAWRVLLGQNFHVAVAGQVYRGSQLTPDQLERLVKRLGVRTVVNLRGLSNPSPWYMDQCRMIQQLSINQHDLNLSALRLPAAQEMRRLVEILDSAEYPLYFHCRRGADRTGLASAIARLLRTGCDVAEAHDQLHWRHGHIPYGRLASMDEFFGLYTAWLERSAHKHSGDLFRHWLLHEYRGACNYVVEKFHKLPEVPIDACDGPARTENCVSCEVPLTRSPLRQGQGLGVRVPIAFEVRLRNTGLKTWTITTHARAGFHLGYRVWDESGKMVREGRSWAKEERIAPGAILACTVVIPGELMPGKYRIMVDLIEEAFGWCYQTGTEPMEGELEVCE